MTAAALIVIVGEHQFESEGAGKGHPASTGEIGKAGKLRLQSAESWPSSVQAFRRLTALFRQTVDRCEV
jgi:hypothetical protein